MDNFSKNRLFPPQKVKGDLESDNWLINNLLIGSQHKSKASCLTLNRKSKYQ